MDNIKNFFEIIESMRTSQEENLLNLGRQFIPNLTKDDLLQPNDFQELENNPHFRYEEGILSGILSLEAAFKAFTKDYKEI